MSEQAAGGQVGSPQVTRKIYVCGRVYEITPKTITKVERKIQKRIDKMDEAAGLVRFSMNVSDDFKLFEFQFHRNNLFAKVGVDPGFVNDSDGQLFFGLDGKHQPPFLWQIVHEFAPFRYNIPRTEFWTAYIISLHRLGLPLIAGFQIESSRSEFCVRVWF